MRGTKSEAIGFVMNLASERSEDGGMTALSLCLRVRRAQSVCVPILVKYRGGHSHGRATLKDSNVVTS